MATTLESTTAGAGRSEGPLQIPRSGSPIQSGLGAGGRPAAQSPHQGQTELHGQGAGDLLRLIEAPSEMAEPMQRDRDHEIGLRAEMPVVVTQLPSQMMAQKRQAAELHGVDDLLEWRLIQPARLDPSIGRRNPSAGTTEIGFGKGILLQSSVATRAKAQREGLDTLDALAGDTNRRKRDREQLQTGRFELGLPGM